MNKSYTQRIVDVLNKPQGEVLEAINIAEEADKVLEAERKTRIELEAHVVTLRAILKEGLSSYYDVDFATPIDSFQNRAIQTLGATPNQSFENIQAIALERIRFPVELRKVWSASEVQEFLDSKIEELKMNADNIPVHHKYV